MAGKAGFHPLIVTEIRRETADAVSIRFAVPPGLADLFAFQPGQFLTLRAVIDGEDLRRTYSVCAAPCEKELRVAVKMLAGGKFSSFLNLRLKAGEALDVSPASGHFTTQFKPGQIRHYAAFAAGSGITPVLSLIKAALSTEGESHFSLFYGNRASHQILFFEELAHLKNRFMARFRVFHFLTSEEDEVALFNGRLDRAKCDEILETLIDPRDMDMFFVCGPEGMMMDAEQALLARGVRASDIRLERFRTAGPDITLDTAMLPRVIAAAGRQVGIVLDGRKFSVGFEPSLGNILGCVLAAGVPAPHACKGGVCATCRAKKLSGEVDMRINYGLSAEEIAQGYILTCQSTPATDDVVVSYDT